MKIAAIIPVDTPTGRGSQKGDSPLISLSINPKQDNHEELAGARNVASSTLALLQFVGEWQSLGIQFLLNCAMATLLILAMVRASLGLLTYFGL